MEYFFGMAQIQGVLFIYLLVGMFARKTGIIPGDSTRSFINYLIKIALPCMIFNSFNLEMTRETLLKAGSILIISTVVSLLTIPLGKLLYRRVPTGERSVMQYGTLVSNAGFAGLPLVSAAFGQEALFYASIYLVPTRILMWSAGLALFTGQSSKTRLKAVLLNPGIVAVELGFLRMLLRLELPWVIDSALQHIGDSTASLSIIVVGAMLAEVDIRTVLDRNVLYLTFVRLILIPVTVLLALRAIGADFLLIASSVVLLGMPVGTNTALLAQQYDADYQFASKCVFVSTLFSLITAPLLTLLL